MFDVVAQAKGLEFPSTPNIIYFFGKNEQGRNCWGLFPQYRLLGCKFILILSLNISLSLSLSLSLCPPSLSCSLTWVRGIVPYLLCLCLSFYVRVYCLFCKSKVQYFWGFCLSWSTAWCYSSCPLIGLTSHESLITDQWKCRKVPNNSISSPIYFHCETHIH